MPDYQNLRALAAGKDVARRPALKEAEVARLRGDETKCHQRLIRKVADQETVIDALLEALRLTTNIAECGGYCRGYWTPEHQALAREYAAKGRAAIAKATIGVAEATEAAEPKGA